MNIFTKFGAYLKIRTAIRKADNAHVKTGERYYVIPSTDGKLLIIDRMNFRGLKRKHYIKQDARVIDLVNECFYFTPYRNGDRFLDAEGRKKKMKLYYSWVVATRKLRKERKKNAKRAKKEARDNKRK